MTFIGPELIYAREDEDGSVEDISRMVDLAVLHFNLGILEPDGNAPMVDVQRSFEDGTSPVCTSIGSEESLIQPEQESDLAVSPCVSSHTAYFTQFPMSSGRDRILSSKFCTRLNEKFVMRCSDCLACSCLSLAQLEVFKLLGISDVLLGNWGHVFDATLCSFTQKLLC